MVSMPLVLENMILEARALFRQKTEAERPGTFVFYRMDEYLGSQTILDNILFGKAKSLSPQVQEKINQNIIQLLIEDRITSYNVCYTKLLRQPGLLEEAAGDGQLLALSARELVALAADLA